MHTSAQFRTCNKSHNVFCTQETWGSFLLQEWTILGGLCILSFFGCLFSSYICCMRMKGVLIDLKKWTWSHCIGDILTGASFSFQCGLGMRLW